MTPRQKAIVQMALIYMKANIDDVNDAFANFTKTDPRNERGLVRIYKKAIPSVSPEEVEALQKLMK